MINETMCKAWFEAAEWDEVDAGRALYQEEPDIVFSLKIIGDEGFGYSALHVAAHRDSDGFTGFLLDECELPPDHGLFASPDSHPVGQEYLFDLRELAEGRTITALNWAAESCSMLVVDALLTKGADPNGRESVTLSHDLGELTANRPLHRGICCHNASPTDCTLDLIEQLLCRGANPNIPMRQSRWFGTPLAYAWRVCGDAALCELLLKHGAALGTDDLATVQYIIRKESDRDDSDLLSRFASTIPDIRKRYTWGSLIGAAAIYTDCMDADKLLPVFLQAGADPTTIWPHRLWPEADSEGELAQSNDVNLDGLRRVLTAMRKVGSPVALAMDTTSRFAKEFPKISRDAYDALKQAF